MTLRAVIQRASGPVRLAAALALSGASALAGASPSQAAGRHPAPDCGCGNVTQFTYSGPTAAATGTERYLVFTPDSYHGRRRVPLVVVTHGCNTTAAQQEGANDYDQIAEKYGFIVMYPDDNDAIHPVQCWQFYNPINQHRGRGDVGTIAGMTRAVLATYKVDRRRVYEIGMSSGALLTSDLGATYPDLYAAIGIMAGGPFGNDACLSGVDLSGGGVNPQLYTSAAGAYRAEGAYARVMPVIVLNGDADTTVNPICDQLAIEQWLATDDLVIDGEQTAPLVDTPSATKAGQVPRGYSYRVYDYTEPGGCLIAQHWVVHGMGHYWSGGTSNPAYSAYTDPNGPSASKASWAFFSRYTLASTGRRCSPAKP